MSKFDLFTYDLFSCGFYTGVVLAIILEVLFIRGLQWLWRQNDLPETPLPVMESAPPRIPDYVKNRARYKSNAAETCEWFNNIVHKIVYDFVGREPLEDSFTEKLTFDSEQLTEKDITFLSYVKILEFQMGEQLPQLRSVQLIMADESQSLVSATLEYEGGIKCRAEAMLTALNLQIQITVSIPLIKGSLAIRSNTTHLQVCFNEAPLIELRMRFKAGSFVSPKIASFLERKIKKIILDEMVFPGAITIPYTNHDKEPTHRLKLRFPKCTLSKVSDSKRKPNRNLFVLVNCQRKKTPSSRTAVPDWSGATLTYEINLEHTSDSIEIEMFDDLGGVSKLFGVGVAKMLLPDTSNTAQTTSGSIALPHIEFVLRNPTGDDHSEFDLHDPGSGLVAKLSVSATLTRMATTDGAPTTDTARAKKLPATESNISNISHAPTAQNSSHGRYDRRQMTREDMEHAIAELEDKLDGEADE